MRDITRVLSAIERGEPLAAEELLPLVYSELRSLAAQKIAWEKPGITLQATALVHEAYVRLVDVVDTEQRQRWNSRGHFFTAAAEAMRRVLVDEARRRNAEKRGGKQRRAPLAAAAEMAAEEGEELLDLLDLDAALTELESLDPVKARLVQLRYFSGLSLENSAEALGISPATAKRYWVFARAWLYGKLHGDGEAPPRNPPEA
jgi:RNA polymerase sigma factor (TIGR02999 family)